MPQPNNPWCYLCVFHTLYSLSLNTDRNQTLDFDVNQRSFSNRHPDFPTKAGNIVPCRQMVALSRKKSVRSRPCHISGIEFQNLSTFCLEKFLHLCLSGTYCTGSSHGSPHPPSREEKVVKGGLNERHLICYSCYLTSPTEALHPAQALQDSTVLHFSKGSSSPQPA